MSSTPKPHHPASTPSPSRLPYLQFMSELNFEGNLRESMAKYNVTSLFDGMFAKTASSLMAKTRLGSKVRLTDRSPLDTLHRHV